MDFSKIIDWVIPEGSVKSLHINDVLVWNRANYYYVSLGDSIAAGHAINAEWEEDYGYKSQYGEGGNKCTVIVPDSYTDLFRTALNNKYGQNDVSSKSFAHSGDTVADLIAKLDHPIVISAIEKANWVTICIGANDILQPAMDNLGDYINTGNPALVSLGEEVQANIDILNNDANANSYNALFKKLKGINPNAKYVFTTIYNPLKYLWLDESTELHDYKDGFFGPLMWAIPETFGNISNAIRNSLYTTSAVQTVFDRINGPSRNGSDGLASWTETYITKLNQVLKDKISAFGNSNFIVADSKALYDTFPDRNVGESSYIHYNDLVNVEFTSGYVVQDMDWGQFWSNFSLADLTGNPENVMSNVMVNIVNNVIVPDIDPHPEDKGHEMLYHSFADTLGWESLPRYTISYNANGGTGAMQSQVLVGISSQPAYTNISQLGFTADSSIVGNHFVGWNTQANGGGSSYDANDLIGISANTTLYAQWSNKYKITYFKTKHSSVHDMSNTGPLEDLLFWIYDDASNTTYTQLGFGGAFNQPPNAESPYVIEREYGTKGLMGCRWDSETLYAEHKNCPIYLNGVQVGTYLGLDVGGWTSYEPTVTSNMIVDYQWHYDGNYDSGLPASWWECRITTY